MEFKHFMKRVRVPVFRLHSPTLSLRLRRIVRVGYADDVVIITRGKFYETVKEIMGSTLRKTKSWYEDVLRSVTSDPIFY